MTSQALQLQTPEERKEWLGLRQSGIGGSDAAAIIGLDPYGKTIERLYDEKVGVVVDEPPTPPMLRGRYLEGITVLLFCERTGRKLRRMPMRRHKEHPFMIANVDRQQVNDPRGPGVFEAKAPGIQAIGRLKRHGLSKDNKTGFGYMIQGQHYMEVLDYDWCTFAFLSAELWKLIWFDMERDREIGAFLVEQEGKFWNAVEQRERPAPPPLELPKMPEVKGEIVMRTDPEWEAAVADYREAKQLAQTAEEVEEFAKERLKVLMGGHGIAEGAGLRAYFREVQRSGSFDKKALERAGPLDPTAVAIALAAAGIEPTSELGKQIAECRLDLTQFHKPATVYEEFRGYLLKPPPED